MRTSIRQVALPLVALSFFAAAKSSAQTTAWRTLGNASVAGEFIGTTNAMDLIFKTGNVQRMSLSTSGVLQINSLASSNNGLVLVTTQGTLQRINLSGSTTDVLTANGTFATASSISGWTQSASGMYNAFTGNIGIGTNTPQYKLDIAGTTRIAGNVILPNYASTGGYSQLLIDPGGNLVPVPPSLGPGSCNTSSMYDWNLHGNANTNPATDFVGTCDVQPLAFRTGNIEWMRLELDGFLGIGTSQPNAKIHALLDQTQSQNDVEMRMDVKTNTGTETMFYIPSLTGSSYNPVVEAGSMGLFWSDGLQPDGKNLNKQFVIAPWSATQGGLVIGADGNVGVGMSSPQYRLDVCGTIRSKEIKVEMTGCDFVFENKYNLMPINDLKAFVVSNHHLPEIATAEYMEKNGVELAALNSKYLQKIEELTLYIIQLNERISKLEKKQDTRN